MKGKTKTTPRERTPGTHPTTSNNQWHNTSIHNFLTTIIQLQDDSLQVNPQRAMPYKNSHAYLKTNAKLHHAPATWTKSQNKHGTKSRPRRPSGQYIWQCNPTKIFSDVTGYFTHETESPWPLEHFSLAEKAEPVQVHFKLQSSHSAWGTTWVP